MKRIPVKQLSNQDLLDELIGLMMWAGDHYSSLAQYGRMKYGRTQEKRASLLESEIMRRMEGHS